MKILQSVVFAGLLASCTTLPESARAGTRRPAFPARLAVLNYPVVGSIWVNGRAEDLGTGATFVAQSFNAQTGQVGPGAFVYPAHTVTYSTSLGPAVVTYQIVQTNQSGGTVQTDTSVSLSMAEVRTDILAASLGGFTVVSGNCSASPVTLELSGHVESGGMFLRDDQFTIPSFSGSGCGTAVSILNSFFLGDNNSVSLIVKGAFVPDAAGLLFRDGFDIP